MPETMHYYDGNWNPVDDASDAAFRLVTVYDDNGIRRYQRRESVGDRQGRRTYSTDPRAGAIMRDGERARPMSRPVD